MTIVIVLLPAFVVFFLCGSASHASEKPVSSPAPSELSRSVDALGIEVTGITLSASGYMLDFRYRVMDPEKAYSFVSGSIKPHLINEKTGEKLLVPDTPKMGSLRQKTRKPEAGRIYFAIFGNPGGIVKKGDRVTVVVGETRIEHLVVR